MRRQTSTTPYVPHRYIDELPDTAFANFGVWRDRLERGDREPHALAIEAGANVFVPHPDTGASLPEILAPSDLFETLAAGIEKLDFYSRREAIVAIFGSLAERDVGDIIRECVEEPDMPELFRDLQGRIIDRIESGHWNDADLGWIKLRAAEQVTDDDFLHMLPFDGGKEGDVRELARKVVRGRKDHVCHGTGLVIPAGEPHLLLRELIDGEFYATRHGRVSAWFEVYAEAPELAEMLKRDERPLAAAA
ncbi:MULTISPECIES: hypothetical protein [Methylobacterium]|uniref:Uncharacterized protein n=2 Tax=Methylobacterium TaxID=407 RepID=A0ABQ4SY72_9HYPH|nr:MULTISPECIES: hypothetical protein [Methylobacterium]PIU05516.1 MAG: hypothetical protein COT56_14065 [Methylobacterium sp. CG09_land_8_20_14_0_10_71_15]PIU13587.1 MAG: hypothetical protein COT28_10845 [Methylobacterium sp. CG08_land_8_20_14_0_20_71_15]GBU17020.1 hypothetical protein AwMethylo_12350 [Methylobacterium sp.]GJD91155.1 hypothetical protein BHAOGJBA_4703 [Methylobacterium hispanicum]GJE06890.1 hypothetical protein AOPFMNJM_2213 [Methylobacterium jeotgali]